MTNTSETARPVAMIVIGGRDPSLSLAITRALAAVAGSHQAVHASGPDTNAPRPKGPLTQAIEQILGDAPATGEVARTHYAHVRGKEPFDPYGIFNVPGRKLLRGTW
jgi:hypothetical protein